MHKVRRLIRLSPDYRERVEAVIDSTIAKIIGQPSAETEAPPAAEPRPMELTFQLSVRASGAKRTFWQRPARHYPESAVRSAHGR